MKREGNIIQEIIQEDNINHSIDIIIHGKKRKKSRIGRWILKNRGLVVEILARKIKNGTFRISGYKEMTVLDGPKVRKVQSVPMLERIGVNAIMSVIEERIYRKYIRTTGASIKNRGTHDQLKYICNDMKIHGDELRYFYKSDFSKFYENIDQDFMMYCLRRMFKEKILLTILERFVTMMPHGISIGLRSSQTFGNILLSMFLDHYLKDEMRFKHIYRYCDDNVGGGMEKRECWKIRDEVHKRAEFMKLKVKSNDSVFPSTNGLDYLGFVIFPTHVRLRKRIKHKFACHINQVKSKKRKRELIASFYGMCKHANCNNLFYKLTGMKIHELKDLKIKPKYSDNKKRFDVERVSVTTLANMKIVVLDFETGVVPRFEKQEYEQKVLEAKAKYTDLLKKYKGNIPDDVKYVKPEDVPHPVGRYLVRVKKEIDGSEVKFFTDCKDNWSILDQAKEQDVLPFACTILPQKIENHNGYKYVLS